eukprot:95251_1
MDNQHNNIEIIGLNDERNSMLNQKVKDDTEQYTPAKSSIIRNNILILILFCMQSAMIFLILYTIFVPTLTLENKTYPHREYNTQIYFWMNKHRNDKGPHYAYFVATHAITGYITFLSVLFPVYFLKGSYWHIITGKASILCIVILMITSLVLEVLYLENRGFLVCQYESNSFNLFITLQFVPWFFWLCELVMYGHTAVVYRTSINGSKQFNETLKNYLIYSSVLSIVLCIVRIPVFFVLLSEPKTMECVEWYEIVLNAAACVSDLGGIYWSYYNIKYIRKSQENKVTDDGWKSIHGRDLIVVMVMASFVIIGITLYKFVHLLYLSLVYGFLIPVLFVVVRYNENPERRRKRGYFKVDVDDKN